MDMFPLVMEESTIISCNFSSAKGHIPPISSHDVLLRLRAFAWSTKWEAPGTREDLFHRTMSCFKIRMSLGSHSMYYLEKSGKEITLYIYILI